MSNLVDLAQKASDLISNYKRTLIRTRTIEVCRDFMSKFSVIFNQYIKLKELEVNTKIIEDTEAIFDKLSQYMDNQYDILNKEQTISSGEESSSSILDQSVKKNIGNNNKVDLKFNPEHINNQINQVQPIMANFDVVNKRVNANIPLFSGGSGETVRSELNFFLDISDFVMNSLEQNDDIAANFLSCLKGRLRGIAYEIVKKANPVTFDNLKTVLRELYLPKKTISEVNQALYSCKQKSNEPTREFVIRIKGHLEEAKALLREKFPEHNISLLANIEAEAINVFKRGAFNVGMKHYLLLNDAATLNELATAAYLYEDTERQVSAGLVYQAQASPINTVYGNNNNNRVGQNMGYNQFNRQQYNNNNQYSNYRGQNFSNQQNTKQMHNGYNNRNRSVQDNYGRNFQGNNMRYQYKCGLCGNSGHTDQFCALGRKCPNCKTWDHSIKYCPYNNKKFEKEDNGFVFCENCGMRGHISDKCPAQKNHSNSNEVSGKVLVQAKDMRASAQ